MDRPPSVGGAPELAEQKRDRHQADPHPDKDEDRIGQQISAGDHQRQHGADHDEGERQRQVAPRRNPMQWYQHEANETRLARVQDHNDLLKMMRLHFEAPRAVDGELTLRRRNRLHLARPTNMSMDLIIGVTRCVQDHLLTNRHVDLLPAQSGLPIRDRDVDGQRVVTSSR